jgi:DNA modification methylase
MRRSADGKNTQRTRGGIKRHGKFGIDWKVERAYRDTNFTNVWSFLPPTLSSRNGTREHPTQKPEEVMARLAEMLSPEGATVLDPFMGSGTTGVACVQTGRNFIGIEIDPTYFAIAERRIEEARQQLRMPL